jgi:putative ABC transport system substrate-binding protein
MSGRTRRQFVRAAGALALAAGGAGALAAAGALNTLPGRPPRIPRVGYAFFDREAASTPIDSLREGLRDLGWVDGQNIAFDLRQAASIESQADSAVELALAPVDVLAAAVDLVAVAAHRATTTTPIVMLGIDDPVQQGLVTSLAHPGSNVTGMVRMIGPMCAKHVEVLNSLLPSASRIAVLVDASETSPANMQLWLRDVQTAAGHLALDLQRLEINCPDQVQPAFAEARRMQADAMLVLPGSMMREQAKSATPSPIRH